MYQIKTNEKEFSVDFDDQACVSGRINSKKFIIDQKRLRDKLFHIIYKGKSHIVERLLINKEENTAELKIDEKIVIATVYNERSLLLNKIGISSNKKGFVSNIKAPMPGKVLDIFVGMGDEIKAGDPLLILEAMKMENILKAPSDGRIKSINVESEMAVAKDAVLVVFE